MSDKKFCGGGKEKTFDNGGSIINIGLSPADIEVILANKKGSGWVNIKCCKMKTPTDKRTHYLEIDDYVAKVQEQGIQQAQGALQAQQPQQQAPSGLEDFKDNDIPF